jgi:hypothetical protein
VGLKGNHTPLEMNPTTAKSNPHVAQTDPKMPQNMPNVGPNAGSPRAVSPLPISLLQLACSLFTRNAAFIRVRFVVCVGCLACPHFSSANLAPSARVPPAPLNMLADCAPASVCACVHAACGCGGASVCCMVAAWLPAVALACCPMRAWLLHGCLRLLSHVSQCALAMLWVHVGPIWVTMGRCWSHFGPIMVAL